MLYAISALILVTIAIGLSFRRDRNVHPKIMFGAFTADVALVLYIELTRGAVERVVSEVSVILWIHAAISLTVVLLYITMIVLGLKLKGGNEAVRNTHRNLGYTFVVFRSANFVTSFMV